jgi:hypothetical protein
VDAGATPASTSLTTTQTAHAADAATHPEARPGSQRPVGVPLNQRSRYTTEEELACPEPQRSCLSCWRPSACGSDDTSGGGDGGGASTSKPETKAKVGVILPDAASSARWETNDRKFLGDASPQRSEHQSLVRLRQRAFRHILDDQAQHVSRVGVAKGL